MRLSILGVVALLAGCAASAPQYYSLQAPAMASDPQGRKVAADYVISVQPVLIPEDLARPQIVVASPDGAEVVPLNAALWAGPLESQIRDALADSLSRRLNVVDIGLARTNGSPVWKIFVDVQRFDSLYAQEVRQELVWRMEPDGMSRKIGKRVCAAQVSVPVEEGMSALVAGHRRALDVLAGLIAQTLPTGKGAALPRKDTESTQKGVNFRGCVS